MNRWGIKKTSLGWSLATFSRKLSFSQALGCRTSLLHFAQLFLGIYIGLLLKKEDIKLSKRHLFYSFFSSGILIIFALGISYLMQKQNNLSFATSFLSVVPGGLDQMTIIAASVHADVTIVTAFQLFRIFFLSVCIIPFVKMIVNRGGNRSLKIRPNLDNK